MNADERRSESKSSSHRAHRVHRADPQSYRPRKSGESLLLSAIFVNSVALLFFIGVHRRLSAVHSLLVVVSALAATAHAQHYPAKPIRFVVGFSAGGASDITSRIIGQRLSELLGPPVVIDNRAGASGTIAGSIVAKAPAD